MDRRINSFLIKRPFHIELAIESSAKIALVASKLLKQNFDAINIIHEGEDLSKYIIEGERSYLNKLSKNGTLALYYWYQTNKLLI